MSEPVFLSLLFADRVIEEINHKKSIIGTFTTFNAPQFPALFPPWYVYAAFTNLDPNVKHTFSLVLAHRDSQHVVFSNGGEFSVNGLEVAPEIVAAAQRVLFPTHGSYVLTLYVDSRELASRVLSVNLISPVRGA